MEDKREVQYDFCPKCGAMARNGVCSSCGHVNPQYKGAAGNAWEEGNHNKTGEEDTVWQAGKEMTEQKPTEPEMGAEGGSREPRPYEAVFDQYNRKDFETAGQNSETTGQNSQIPGESSAGAYYGSPYSEYANQISYTNGAIPPDKPEKDNNGKVVAIILSCIGFVVLLLVLMGLFVYQAANKLNDQKPDKSQEESRFDNKDDDKEDFNDFFGEESEEEESEEEYNYRDFYDNAVERNQTDNNGSGWEDNGKSEVIGGKSYGFSPEDDYYKELKTILRSDLPYSIKFDTASYRDRNGDVDISCYYPIIEGEIANRSYLNDIIYEEYQYFLDFYEDNMQDDMRDEDYFICTLEGYVTYMDEKTLSIVFAEDADTQDYFLLALYCINIDVENGVVLNNTELLEVNDDFSVDFRVREGEQNGSDTLDWYTDQELTQMFSDPVSLIVFYTPLGMEVGLNHDFGWATTTYKDYEKYLKRF